jgi:hypothetical protein
MISSYFDARAFPQKTQVRKGQAAGIVFRHLSKELLMGSDAGFKAVSVVQTDEELMNRLEDLELIALCKEWENDPTIKVSIDDL